MKFKSFVRHFFVTNSYYSQLIINFRVATAVLYIFFRALVEKKYIQNASDVSDNFWAVNSNYEYYNYITNYRQVFTMANKYCRMK